MNLRFKRVLGIITIACLASSAMMIFTDTGSRIAQKLCAGYLRAFQMGDLELNLQGSLFKGMNSKQGHYRDQKGQLQASWEGLKIKWPSYRRGAFALPFIEVQGLTLQLPGPDTEDPDSKDWLVELSETLSRPPSLPSWSVDTIRLQQTKLLRSDGFPLASIRSVNGSLHVKERRLAIKLEATKLQGEKLDIDQVQSQATWGPNLLNIQHLELRAPIGHAILDDLSFQTNSERLAFETLQVHLPTDSGIGSGALHLRAPDGNVTGTFHYRQGPTFNARGQLQGRIANLRAVELMLEPECDPCGVLPLAWKSKLQVQTNATTANLQAQTTLNAPDQALQANFTLQSPQTLDAHFTWKSQDLGKLWPNAQGRSQGQANCNFNLLRMSLACHTQLDIEELYPKTQAKGELDVNWSPTEGLEALIASFQLRAFEQQVQATPRQARLQLSPEGQFSLVGLSLQTPDAGSLLQLQATRDAKGQIFARAQAKQWELALVSAFVPGLNLKGTLNADLELSKDADALRAKLRGQAHNIHWRGIPWGQLTLRADQKHQQLRLRGQLKGRRHANLTFSGSIPAHQLSRWPSKARAQLKVRHLSTTAIASLTGSSTFGGHLRGSAQYVGHHQSPTLSGQLEWVEPRWRNIKAKRLNVQALVTPTNLDANAELQLSKQSHIGFDAKLPLRPGPASWPQNWDRSRRLNASLEARQVSLKALGRAFELPGLGGRVDAKLTLEGLAHNPKLQGWASVWQPSFHNIHGKELNLSLRHEHQESKIELAAYRKKGELRAHALVPVHLDLLAPTFAWQPDRHHQIKLTIDKIDSSMLRGIVELPPSLIADATLWAKGTRQNLRGNANLRLSSTSPELTAFKLIAGAKLGAQEQRLHLTLSENTKTQLEAKIRLHGHLEKLSNWKSLPAQVHAYTNNLKLTQLERWLPTSLDRPRGSLDANIRGKGPLGAMRFTGSAQVRNAGLTVPAMQQRWSGLNADIRLDGDRFLLSSLRAKVGSGTLKGSGEARLGTPLTGKLDLKLRRIPLSLAGIPDMQATANLAINAQVTPEKVNIDATLAKAQIEVSERYNASVKDIPSNANIRFATEKEISRSRTGSTLPAIRLRTRIQDTLKVEGQSVSTAWTGELTLIHQREKTRATGQLRAAPRGSFDLLNNHFVLERAKLNFSESQGLVPFVDLRAQTQVESEDISVTAQGPANNPTLRFESSTHASKNEILSALVTGHTDQNQDGQNRLLAKAASMLIAEHTEGLGQIAKRIGVDNLRVSFGDSLSDTIVSAGTWIRPRVYLESRVRAQAPEGQSRVQGRIRFNFKRSWVLEGYVGDRSRGGGGLWWHRPPKTFKRRSAATGQPVDPSTPNP